MRLAGAQAGRDRLGVVANRIRRNTLTYQSLIRFLQTLGIPIRLGRDIGQTDTKVYQDLSNLFISQHLFRGAAIPPEAFEASLATAARHAASTAALSATSDTLSTTASRVRPSPKSHENPWSAHFRSYASVAVTDPSYDPGNKFTIPWQSGFTGIGYNPKLTKREIARILTVPIPIVAAAALAFVAPAVPAADDATSVLAASVLAGCATTLRDVQRDVRAAGWSPELARKALARL